MPRHPFRHFLAAFVAGTISTTANAQEAAQQKAWIVNCNNAQTDHLICTMSYSLFVAETGQQIISVMVYEQRTDDQLMIRFTLPHGLDLAAGIGITIDEGITIEYPIQTADQNGAYSTIQATPEVLSLFYSGQVMRVGMRSADGQDIEVEISLSGFASGLSLF